MKAPSSSLAITILVVLVAIDGLLIAAHLGIGRLFFLDFDLAATDVAGGGFAVTLELLLLAAVGLGAGCMALFARDGGLALGWGAVGAAMILRALDVGLGLSSALGGNLAHIRFFWRLADWQPRDPARLAFFLALLPLLVLVYGALGRFFFARLAGPARWAGLAGVGGLALASIVGALDQGPAASAGARFSLVLKRGLDLLGPSLLAFAVVAAAEELLGPDRGARVALAASRSKRFGGATVAVLAVFIVGSMAWVRPPGDRGLDPMRWAVSSSDGGPQARLAADGDPATIWTSAESQRPGQWIQVDFGRPTEIEEVVLFVGGDVMDGPRELELWAAPAGLPPRPLDFGRIVGEPPSSRQRLRFDPPITAQVLRFVQQGEHGLYHWSVRELYVQGTSR